MHGHVRIVFFIWTRYFCFSVCRKWRRPNKPWMMCLYLTALHVGDGVFICKVIPMLAMQREALLVYNMHRWCCAKSPICKKAWSSTKNLHGRVTLIMCRWDKIRCLRGCDEKTGSTSSQGLNPLTCHFLSSNATSSYVESLGKGQRTKSKYIYFFCNLNLFFFYSMTNWGYNRGFYSKED